MPRQPISVPTTAPLPPTLLLDPKSSLVQKSISRLSRASLIALALDWLEPHSIELAMPSLLPNEGGDEDEDEEDDGDFYPRARSVEGLRKMYLELQTLPGPKKEVADRITEGDWRHGLTLYQLAMLDFQHFHDHPNSLKWSSYRLVSVKFTGGTGSMALARQKTDKTALAVPRFHPSTFLQRLQAQVMPDSKTHFHFTRPHNRPVALLRIFMLDTPYNTSLALDTIHGFDTARTIVVAFPDNAPYVYISNSQGTSAGETKKMRNLIVEGLPKALSRPGQMYAFKPVALMTKNLDVLLAGKGPGSANAAQGGWSVYVEDHKRASPLDMMLPVQPFGNSTLTKRKAVAVSLPTKEERAAKKAKLVAQARFGNTAQMDDGQGVEKVLIALDEPFRDVVAHQNGEGDGAVAQNKLTGRKRGIQAAFAQDEDEDENEDDDELIHDDSSQSLVVSKKNIDTQWRPVLQIMFQGPHVFAGIRQLVEAGIIDGKRMPGWMTGEEGVSVGIVQNGRIRGYHGSGV